MDSRKRSSFILLAIEFLKHYCSCAAVTDLLMVLENYLYPEITKINSLLLTSIKNITNVQ